MPQNVLRGFLSIFGTKIGLLLVGVLTTPIIVRFLGSGGYGDYALVLSVYSIVSVFTQSGIFNGIRKFIAEERSVENWASQIFGFYFRISIFVTGLFVGLIILASNTALVVDLFTTEFQTYFLILAVYLFAGQFYSVGRGVLMGFGLEHLSEPIQILRKLIYVSTSIVLLYFGYAVSGVLIAQVISAFVVGFVAFWFIRNRISISSVLKPASNSVPRYQLLTFNVYSILLAFLTISLYHVDILLLRPIVGSTETGFYKASLVVAEFMWLVPMAIQYSLVHSTSEMWAKEEQDAITDLAATSTRLNLTLVVIMVIGLAALADVFVPIYFGSEFGPSVGPLLLLLPGVIGFALARPIFAIGQGKGELRTLVFATGGAAVLNLVLNLLLIPSYGMYGAAIATSIGYGSMFAFHVWTARKIGFDPIADLRISGILVAGAISAVVVFILATVLPPVPALLLIPPIGFVMYSILVVRLGVIDTEEINRLKHRSPETFHPLFDIIVSVSKAGE
jgi:O-antigen/teichoic acid export membrane protein